MALQPSSHPFPTPPMGTLPGAAPGVTQPPAEGKSPEGTVPGFLQQPWVQTVLPFVTSLTVHVGILVIALVAVKLAVSVGPILLHQEQTIIPEATLVEAGPPGGVPNNDPAVNPFTPAMQDASTDAAKPEGWASNAGPQVDLQASGSLGDPDPSPSIGLGAGSLVGANSNSGVAGSGSGDGSGPLAMWGFSGGGAIGPHGIVFGHGGNARKIVFVCDSTGSMLNKMASLKNELGKAVNGLNPTQSFDVVFFHDEKCLAMNMTQLETATPESKRNAFRFLDNITASGTTNPLPAIETAFRLQPQLIYLLSDAADFPDNKAVLELCRKLNPSHKIKVNTILFYENATEAEKNKDSEDLMVQIAKEAGGNFRHVIMTDLEN